MTTAQQPTTAEQIIALAERVDLRYFDSSPDNVSTTARTAGETLRADAKRAEYRNPMAPEMILNLLRMTVNQMDAVDRAQTMRALQICEHYTR